jgi:hypothetical protein
MGVAFSTSAAILALAGATTGAEILLALLVVAAGLESIFAVCLGCHVFALLMRTGLVPESVCLECLVTSAGRPDPRPDRAGGHPAPR